MSVKLIDNEAFYGYRVRRTVDGKLYQEYFSLKSGGKRMNPAETKKVEAAAKARDAVLEKQQSSAKEARKPELCFHDDGSVKGISFLKKKEKSGNLTPIFQVGVASEVGKVNGKKKIVCTSFSINAHGLKGAWEKAVDAYTQHKNIKKGTALYKEIAAAMPKVDLSDVNAAAKKVAGKKAAPKKAAKKAAPKKAAKKVVKKAAKKAAAKKVVKKVVKKAAKKVAPKKAAKKVVKKVAKKAAPKKAAKKKAAKKKK